MQDAITTSAHTAELLDILQCLVEMWNDDNCDQKVLRALFRDAEAVIAKAELAG